MRRVWAKLPLRTAADLSPNLRQAKKRDDTVRRSGGVLHISCFEEFQH